MKPIIFQLLNNTNIIKQLNCLNIKIMHNLNEILKEDHNER